MRDVLQSTDRLVRSMVNVRTRFTILRDRALAMLNVFIFVENALTVPRASSYSNTKFSINTYKRLWEM